MHYIWNISLPENINIFFVVSKKFLFKFFSLCENFINMIILVPSSDELICLLASTPRKGTLIYFEKFNYSLSYIYIYIYTYESITNTVYHEHINLLIFIHKFSNTHRETCAIDSRSCSLSLQVYTLIVMFNFYCCNLMIYISKYCQYVNPVRTSNRISSVWPFFFFLNKKG